MINFRLQAIGVRSFFSIILLSFSIGWTWGCEDNHHNTSLLKNKTPIARVKHQYLYKEDLADIKVDVDNPTDSINLTNHYIQSWVSKQVLIAEAEKNGDSKKADIERKILDYKYALIVHSYLEGIVNSKLDKNITEEEVKQYYQKYQENFTLKHAIVRGKFVTIPKSIPVAEKANLRKWLTSRQEIDRDRLKAYCEQFATDYSLDDTLWINWNDIVAKLPFNKIKNKDHLLKRGKFIEIQDENCTYYLKIDAYQGIGDAAPLALVKEKIIDVILYKRKLALANQVKEDILQKAKVNHEYTIYDNAE